MQMSRCRDMELGPCQITQVLINCLYMYLARHEMIVKAPYECNMGNIVRGAGSRGSYMYTARGEASRPRPKCNISRITRIYGALTDLLCNCTLALICDSVQLVARCSVWPVV